MIARTHIRRGFAMIIAVTIIGLLGVTLLGLVSLLRADIDRTRSAEKQAQLRQLLLAGGRVVEARAKEWPEEVSAHNEAIFVPHVEKGLLFAAIRPEEGAVIIELIATMDDADSQEVLTFRRDQDRWRLDGIEPR